MKKTLSLLTVALLAATLLTACHNDDEKVEAIPYSSQQTKMASEDSHEDKAASFQLEGLDGKTYRLSDFKGKKVYVKFWASWCSICLASLEDSNTLARSVDEDTVVLSVVAPNQMGEQDEASFKKWFDGLGYKDLPVLLDRDGELLKAYQVRSYPTNVFINSEGLVAKTQVGYMDEDMIQQTLAELD